jgi:catalase-peroxidase
MDDEETVALIAGGHTFGKAHGAHKTCRTASAPSPRRLASRTRASAGRTSAGPGSRRKDTVTSGLEGAWTVNPVAFTTNYLDNLMELRVGPDQEPGRRDPVDPVGRPKAATLVP